MWTPLIWATLGLVLGATGTLLWRHVRSSTREAREERATAPELIPTEAPHRGPLMDTHLVLNVLNRFAVCLTDEHLEDGLEALGHYVAAIGRDAKRGLAHPFHPLGESLEAYWRLTEWIHNKPKAHWQLTCIPELSLAERLAASAALLSTLQDLEHTSARQLDISVDRHQTPHDNVLHLTVSVLQPGLKVPKPSTALPWQISPNGYSITLEVHLRPSSVIDGT